MLFVDRGAAKRVRFVLCVFWALCCLLGAAVAFADVSSVPRWLLSWKEGKAALPKVREKVQSVRLQEAWLEGVGAKKLRGLRELVWEILQRDRKTVGIRRAPSLKEEKVLRANLMLLSRLELFALAGEQAFRGMRFNAPQPRPTDKRKAPQKKSHSDTGESLRWDMQGWRALLLDALAKAADRDRLRSDTALRGVQSRLLGLKRGLLYASPAQAGQKWASLFREKHPLLRREGALALGVMGPGGSPHRVVLVELLKDVYPEVREAALVALSRLGLPRVAWPRVLELRKSLWPRESMAAWRAVGALEGKGAWLEKQMRQVWDASLRVGARGFVLQGFVRSGRRSRWMDRVMILALRGPDRESVRWACRYWQRGVVPWSRLQEMLLSQSLSTDAKVRLEALRVLRRADVSHGLREIFLRATQDPSKEVRHLAGEVLVEARWSAWRALSLRLARGDRSLRKGVMEGLKAQGKQGWEKIRFLLRDQRDGMVSLGLTSLALQGTSASSFCEAIHEKMRVRHWSVRVAAVKALGQVCLEQADAVRWLVGMLGDFSEDVRFAAAQALGASPLSPLSFLKESSKSRDWRTRQASARALGDLGGQVKEVRPLLLSLLRDDSWAVRRATVDAMAKLGALVAVDLPKLRKLLRDADRDVKRAAMRAMIQLTQEEKKKRRMLLGWMERRREQGLGLDALRTWSKQIQRAPRSEMRRVVAYVRRVLRRGRLSERQGVLRVLRGMGAVGRLVWPELSALVRGHRRPLQLGALRALGVIEEPPVSLMRSLLAWSAGKSSVKRRVAREVLAGICSRISMSRKVWEPWLRHQNVVHRQMALDCLARGGWRGLSALEVVLPLLVEKERSIRLSAWRVWRGFDLWGRVGLRTLWQARPRGLAFLGEEGQLWSEVTEGAGTSLPAAWPFLLHKRFRSGSSTAPKGRGFALWFRAMLASSHVGKEIFWYKCVERGPWFLRWSCAKRLGRASSTDVLLGALGGAAGVRRLMLREALAQRSGGVLSMALQKLATDPSKKDRWLGYLRDASLWRGEGQGPIEPALRGSLGKLLVSKDPEVRRVAARAYVYWPSLGALESARLVERLVEEDVEARRWVVSALLRQREKSIPALVAALRRSQWAGAEFAIALLLKMGAQAVPILREKLRTGDAQERMYAVYALSEIGEPARSARQEFLMALRDPQQEVQISAAFALCRLRLRSLQAEALLRRFLTHAASEKRLAAARALARLYPLTSKTLRILAARRKSEEPLLREVIFRALGRHLMLEPADIGELQSSLEGTDAASRRYAAKSLALMTKALDLRCADEKRARCRRLREAFGQTVFLDIWLKWLLRGELSVQRSLLEALMYLPRYTPKVVRVILQILSHKESEIRLQAVRLLGQIGLPAASAVPRLMWLLRGDADAEVRREAVRALAKLYALFLGVPRALKDAASDMDVEVAQEAQKALRDLQR